MRVATRSEIGSTLWDEFCSLHDGAWFLWTSAYLDYQAARGTRELSFGIVDGDRLVAICPLFLEEREGVRSFTIEGNPGPGLLHLLTEPESTLADVALSVCHDTADSHFYALVETHHPVRFAARFSPFHSALRVMGCKGARDISWHTQILDLTQPEAALHAGIRKSYTSLINKVNRTHEIVVDDKGELLKAFKRLHFGQAGRQTRPDRTWEIQREWCEAGNGLIVAAMRWNVAVACTYWILYKGCAYFASSASINRNVVHALVWRAMLELKARGVGKLELGWCERPGDSEKEKKIAFFKEGFGGEAVPVIAVERRFDR